MQAEVRGVEPSARFSSRLDQRRICSDAPNAKIVQHPGRLRCEPCRVAGFQQYRAGVLSAQQLEESFSYARIEPKTGWKLHEQCTEFAGQPGDLTDKGSKRLFHVCKAMHMSNGFRDFDGKAKRCGNARRPPRISCGTVRTIKGRIDFNCRKPCRIALKVAACLGKPMLLRRRQGPSRTTDVDDGRFMLSGHAAPGTNRHDMTDRQTKDRSVPPAGPERRPHA
jgi:hypothetical protein